MWAGGPFFLAAMWTMLGLAAAELWRSQRSHARSPASEGDTYGLALRSMMVGSALVATYYLGRWFVPLSMGQDDYVFRIFFGGLRA